jgi:hypothetical protein
VHTICTVCCLSAHGDLKHTSIALLAELHRA